MFDKLVDFLLIFNSIRKKSVKALIFATNHLKKKNNKKILKFH